MADDAHARLARALWRIYRRAERPIPTDGNLPWQDPAFSERMLREHLDSSHGAASRATPERKLQLDWLWPKLGLRPAGRLLDLTCGPGLYAVELARRGVQVTGIDFSPAGIAHARALAAREGVADHCRFLQVDVRAMTPEPDSFDAAMLLYGQLAVFDRDDAARLLREIARDLAPWGRLCVELLDTAHLDREDSSWWFTDDTGLWGDGPFLYLGERFWDDRAQKSLERYHIVHLESGAADEVILCDHAYSIAQARSLLLDAGFATVDVYPGWDGVPLYDATEWVVYVATR